MLVPNLTIQPASAAIPTADPRPLMDVTAIVLGALVLWVLYTIFTAETRTPHKPASAVPKTRDDAAK